MNKIRQITQEEIDGIVESPCGLSPLLRILPPYELDEIKASLKDLNLRNLNLNWTDLSRCDLRGADLSGCTIGPYTFFDAAIFDENTKMPDYPMACPKEGAFTGYKKALVMDKDGFHDAIVMLYIPECALRSSATGRKCRCDKAKVLEIRREDTAERYEIALSARDKNCIYETRFYVGDDDFDTCRWHECSTGIHFYMTEKEAREHLL